MLFEIVEELIPEPREFGEALLGAQIDQVLDEVGVDLLGHPEPIFFFERLLLNLQVHQFQDELVSLVFVVGQILLYFCFGHLLRERALQD